MPFASSSIVRPVSGFRRVHPDHRTGGMRFEHGTERGLSRSDDQGGGTLRVGRTGDVHRHRPSVVVNEVDREARGQAGESVSEDHELGTPAVCRTAMLTGLLARRSLGGTAPETPPGTSRRETPAALSRDGPVWSSRVDRLGRPSVGRVRRRRGRAVRIGERALVVRDRRPRDGRFGAVGDPGRRVRLRPGWLGRRLRGADRGAGRASSRRSSGWDGRWFAPPARRRAKSERGCGGPDVCVPMGDRQAPSLRSDRLVRLEARLSGIVEIS